MKHTLWFYFFGFSYLIIGLIWQMIIMDKISSVKNKHLPKELEEQEITKIKKEFRKKSFHFFLIIVVIIILIAIYLS